MFFFPVMPKSRKLRQSAKKIYARCVERGRNPVFYESLLVPDTVDGRFEMIALHVGLVINHINGESETGSKLAQSLFDEMFLNMELSCRQIGIGDLGVPKHIKRMMKALQGRALVYEAAAEAGMEAVSAALVKNLYATTQAPPLEILDRMSRYILDSKAALKMQPFETIQQGNIYFADTPQGASDAENSKVA